MAQIKINPPNASSFYARRLKRALDVAAASAALVTFSPVLLIIACCIRMESRGPIFFQQKRVGVNHSYFYINKFRTMYTDAPKDTPTHLLNNPERYITKCGRFLRAASLDELPQLLNILVGDMSFVGPRPALWNQDNLVELREANGSNAVRPGLTGLAQVNGRDELPIAEKARLDGDYAANISFRLDIHCCVMTLRAVFRGSGYKEGGSGG
ncbi:MAG: sugar transferase [Oscillospiraceae bacterium]|jgi:O-antigen biosynthesis protein WbqP|nr:sugar transferase [Oscillospiraceae bacterium]